MADLILVSMSDERPSGTIHDRVGPGPGPAHLWRRLCELADEYVAACDSSDEMTRSIATALLIVLATAQEAVTERGCRSATPARGMAQCALHRRLMRNALVACIRADDQAIAQTFPRQKPRRA